MPAHGVLQWLRLLASATGPARPDHELVSRFVEAGDQAAFTILVQRHGPMVYGVCQRLLEQGQDAEDAFQATFLVFARKARSIRKQASVSCWLYGVASRVAANLRRKTTRERRQETVDHAVPDVAVAEVSWRDVRAVLDEELAKLPERLRLPIVLCYLDGKTRDEAAQELGWSESTLRGRLERGRDLLRGRLTSRGVTLSAALLAELLTENAASALPASLVASTVHALGKPLAGVVSAKVIGLVLMEVNAMFVSKLIHVVLVVCVAALVLGGVVAGTGALLREEQAKGTPALQKNEEKPADNAEDRSEYWIRGVVGKSVNVPEGREKAGVTGGFMLEHATGKGVPKGAVVIVGIRFSPEETKNLTKCYELMGNKKKELDGMPLQFRATTIGIERDQIGHVTEEVKQGGKIVYLEPKSILILGQREYTVTLCLDAKIRKPLDSDDELRRLLIEKNNACAADVGSLDEQRMAGKIIFQDVDNLDRTIRAIERYVESRLELAENHAQRVETRKRAVEAMEIIEHETNHQWKVGKLGTEKAARATQARIEAEIQLLKEQRRAK